jgi:hypothetical protein
VPLLFISFGSFFFLLVHAGTLIYLCSREAREACGVGAGGYVEARPGPRVADQRPRQNVSLACPNPSCRKALRPGWQFCPFCTTRIAPSRQPSQLR